jgi:hypothetical protein
MKIKRRLTLVSIFALLLLAGCGGMNRGNTDDMMNSGGMSPNMLAEMMATPEMQDAMVRVMSSPEMQNQMVEMMKQPEMQNTMIGVMKSPEMQETIIEIMQTPEIKELFKAILNEG